MKIKRFKSENGAVVVIVALSIVALMMVVALAIDVGSLYEERRYLQTVADSAALAGVQELPENVDEAIEIAREYASNCGFNINSDIIDVEISSTLATDDTITVNVINPNAPLYFARVIGLNETQVVASATAIVGEPKYYVGVVPWGVPEDMWEFGDQPVVLKYGSGPEGESFCGNFQALAIDRPGGNEYRYNIIEGAETPLYVGQMVDTETGNLVGPTRKGTETRVYDYPDGYLNEWEHLVDLIEYDDPEYGFELIVPDSQYVIVPIIDGLAEAHGKSEVQIVAFASFIITFIEDMSGDADFGNGIAIIGMFIEKAIVNTDGGINPVQSGGIRVVRLIE